MNRFGRFFKAHLGLHLTVLLSCGMIGLYFLLRPIKALMNFLIQWITTPVKQLLAALLDPLPFALAEVIWGVIILGAPLFLGQTIYRLIHPNGRKRGTIAYRRLLALIGGGLAGYAGFCLLWGINYYGDSFSDKSGISAEPVSVAQLTETTRYFAELTCLYADQVERDENGLFAVSRDEIFARAGGIYTAVGKEFPFLAKESPRPKKIFCSKVMSLLDFTGFYFPFTGESNLNVDSPACMLPATITHELAHQKNIAPEQEANFVAILTALKSGDPVYGYSAALLGYVYLGNALYEADRGQWEAISALLPAAVRADFADNNAYWAKFDTPINQATQSVYNGFLQSYGQTLGVKSYGACVDLLVAYYFPTL